ncbi:MAG: hypothetical protein COX77_04720 [Candidatus Komeilibacteria bacterium CG_4_10_14_0_2_um_filter_37_10]|uniref:Transglycosylase SLT domain-containing protein n=1 Tax=Candidatus Komeilibacteria bacterium CG_4_10_14_0_2_um_filter_37_10 TaxID=1974470 RepID=A0A2M7VDC7_9BACT|nr:MAG: hypothetical protein COX77_04720 [Candidatus Komeilibacteria bacterium CG_4_10_14_0_2_um_filter_37_10]
MILRINQKIFLSSLLIFIYVIVVIPVVKAVEPIKFQPQITVPNSDFKAGTAITVNGSTLGEYIAAIYKYGVSVVSVLAVVMVMLGGWRWIFAAGNAGEITTAKSIIASALIGLVIMSVSYLLLNIINPALVNLPDLNADKVVIEVGCPGVVNNCDAINNLALPNIEQYSKYLQMSTDSESNKKYFQKDQCQPAIYSDKCGLPKNLCYWGQEDYTTQTVGADDQCRSVIDKSCDTGGNTDLKCKFGDIQLYCETYWNNRCSLGSYGSQCDDNTECATGFCDLDGSVSAQGSHTCSDLGAFGGNGGGSCTQVISGPCSVTDLQNGCFGTMNKEEQASGICGVESGGNPSAESGSDICAEDGKPFSIGLFQTNLTVHTLKDSNNQLVNCPSAFNHAAQWDAGAKKYHCQVVNINLYNQCVTLAKTAAININKACTLLQARPGWADWGSCGGSWGSNSKCCYQ